jgi:CheY-like chemotaxis protein
VQPAAEPPAADRERLVLVADPEVDRGKQTASTLVEWGLQTVLVHDGVEAILTIQRSLPRVIVIDAALPRMFGFQICEIVKRNESLRHIQVLLVGAIHNGSRYRRPPGELYGADAYIERPDVPAGLRTILEGFGLLSRSTPAPSGLPQFDPQPTPAAEPQSHAPAAPVIPVAPEPAEPVPATPEPATPERVEPVAPTPPVQEVESGAAMPGDDALGEEVARAERLARIIVSDIIIYNQEKFEAALQAGNVVDAMEAELAEGSSLFVARIDQSLRDKRDFLAEELLRVARLRSES